MPGSLSRNHPASLIPDACHDPDLLHLLRQRVSIDIIQYLANEAATVIDVQESSALPSPPLTPNKVCYSHSGIQLEQQQTSSQIPPLEQFIYSVVESSRVHLATLFCGLVYLRRLRERLPKKAKGGFRRSSISFCSLHVRSSLYSPSCFPRKSHRGC